MSTLLTTNAPPSDQEAQLIRETITELDFRLVELDAEITRLKQEQLAKKGSRDAHQAILSPARRTPMDVWRVIFWNCLPDEEYISPKALSAPLLLCQICRALRELAISMPILWASIAARASISSTQPGATVSYTPHPNLADLWLCRSGTGPLSLSYKTDRDLEGGPVDFRPHTTLDIFTKHSARWNRIRFVFDIRTIPPCLVKKFPSLECVEIQASGWSISFHPAPNLRRVILHTTLARPTPFQAFQKIFPDRQKLTDVALNCSLVPQSMAECLRLCPQLQSLRVDTLTSHTSDLQFPWIPVEHLALQSLELLSNYALEEFFNYVTLPMLSSIKVARTRDLRTIAWADREFASFLSRSACALQKLSLVNVPARDEGHLIAVLRAVTSSLAELHLVLIVADVSVTEGLLKELTARGSPKRPPVCSKLTILWLDIRMAGYNRHLQSRTRTKKGLLAVMAASRWAAFRHDSLFLQLKTIGVCSSHHSGRDLRLLKKYSRMGLEVTLLN